MISTLAPVGPDTQADSAVPISGVAFKVEENLATPAAFGCRPSEGNLVWLVECMMQARGHTAGSA